MTNQPEEFDREAYIEKWPAFAPPDPNTSFLGGVDFAFSKDKTIMTICVECQRCKKVYTLDGLPSCPYCCTPA